MNRLIVLDTGVLGEAVHGNRQRRDPVLQWISLHIANGNSFRIPEIADYELRRELIRMNFTDSIKRLDELKVALGYVPLNTQMIMAAAELWAQARQMGQPTADDRALDGDMILCAQVRALQIARPGDGVVVATTNVGHLARFVQAALWQDIAP